MEWCALSRSSAVQPDAAFSICIAVMATMTVETLAMSVGVFVLRESSSARVISVCLQTECVMGVRIVHLGLMKSSVLLKVFYLWSINIHALSSDYWYRPYYYFFNNIIICWNILVT